MTHTELRQDMYPALEHIPVFTLLYALSMNALKGSSG